MRLSVPEEYLYAEVNDINNSGEAVRAFGNLGFYHPPHGALWKPIDPSRRTHSLTLLPTLTGASTGNIAYGINDLGDIVGNDQNEWGWGIAARWSSNNPSFKQFIGIVPYESFGWAWKVNNQGIALGVYFDPSDNFSVAHQAAVKFR